MQIKMIYALESEQKIYSLDLPDGATVRDAIFKSGILENYPEINLDQNPVGIFAEKVDLSTRLKSGDRIEIYRPLVIDPKEARRLRALKKT